MINYSFLSFLFAWMFPTKEKRRQFRDFCFERESDRQKQKIQKCYKKILTNTKKVAQKRKIRILFLINEITKWKCQTLYDLMAKSDNFEPIIALTISDIQIVLSKPEKIQILKSNYSFFKEKGMNVEYAYDMYTDKAICLKKLNPDIVFYQQPYFLDKVQDIQSVSRYALIYYIPYYVNNFGLLRIDYRHFHKYLYCYYVTNKLWEQFYKENAQAENVKGLGHPMLDTYYLKNDVLKEKHYIIYAPHWSIPHPQNINDECFSTFAWSGDIMLEYAQKHPEINWVFKPHPTLKLALKRIGWSDDEINNYYDAWKKIGISYCGTGYLDMFMQSDAMITDCASFLVEYFYTNKPLIHLISEYNKTIPPKHMKPIFDTFYDVRNKEELCKTLDSVLLNNIDTKKNTRDAILKSKEFKLEYAAKNIMDDIKKDMGLTI